ncbi:MAG: hypothetical protein JXB00_08065 [Bacteroidales bacterium]|nr:hypothetical protein [Bacteroidales bacterium]
MKQFNNIISFFLIIMIFASSCELIDDLASGEDSVSKLEGQWKCDENSENYKKSTMDETYEVYISPYPGDSTRVIISNFYHLGDDVEATARLSGQTLTLSNQSLPGGFTILSGSGTISSSFKQITWSYRIDDGSGDIDNATATYTKIY